MKLRKTMKHGRERWLLDAGIVDGKRRRLFFSSKLAAEKKMALIKSERDQIGRHWSELSVHERWTAAKILAEIKAHGLTLSQVWNAYQAGDGLRTGTVPKPLRDAIQEIIQAKEFANCRPLYVTELNRYLTRFAKGRETMDVSTFRADHIEQWFAKRNDSPHTRATGISRLSAFFDFCWRKKWMAENPCLRLEKVHLEYGIPQILSAQDCEALLRAAEQHDRELLPRLVLMLFAGVRREEVSRLSWTNIDLTRGLLCIDAAASKVRYRRLVPLHPTCVAWLKLGGDLPCVVNLRRRFDQIRLKAGITNWPRDVLRHTAASHLVALHGTAKSADMLGHSESILHRHYRELVQPEETAKFWSIRPMLAEIASTQHTQQQPSELAACVSNVAVV
jgi:integrase